MYESEATAPVYAALALLSADQTGKSVVTLTTNGPVTALDDIDVFKGTKEVEIDSIDYEDDGAVVTLKNAIVADAEYTVTLTPADEDDEATTATFVGEKAELDEIRFLNTVLVVKDQNYKEAYAYAKGYDQFGGEVTLSGITVTPGVGTFKSYDNNTGKITLVDNTANTTGAFMLIKEVPVFIQYQAGNKMISASEVLTVTTQSFVDEVEFEDEIGKDGTKRNDEKLTLSELGSGKYYVAFKTIKDQYGNELSADDLNNQKDTTKATGATLFIIPSNSGAFYTTGDFGELNGKTILWLKPIAGGNGKPGSMPLTITGAGGKTFSKDITIEDNPYIETLTVSYPELYSGSAESAAFEFSAVDQYGEAVDLWDFAPSINANGELEFTDNNRMTTQPTKITISQGAFNTVVKDAGKKSFKVTANMTDVASKTLVVFTVTTAGMQVNTQQVTVGEMGTAAKIKSALSGGNTQLDQTTLLVGKNQDINFNKFIQFEDANGNTMVRGKSEKYPYYVAINGKNIEETLPVSTASVWTANTSSFRWSLTNKKVSDTNGAGVTATDATDYTNGSVGSGNIGASNTLDVYATVYLFDGTSTYYKLDDQVFHLTKVAGTKDVSYSVKAGGTLYDNADSGNEVEIKVSATTNSGETYDVDPSRIKVTPKAPFAVGSTTNKITGKNASALGSGTTTATVYVDGQQVATVDVPYTTDAPKATKVKLKYDIPAGNVGINGSEISRVGKKFDGDFAVDSFTLATGATMEVASGKLTISGANSLGDTITAYIEDQYGNPMGDTVFFVDGTKVTKSRTVNTASADVTIEYTNGTLAGRFILEKGGATANLSYPQTLSRTVTNATSLQSAIKDTAVSEVVINYDITDLDTDIDGTNGGSAIIPGNKKVIIASGKKVQVVAGDDLTVNGTLQIDGSLEIVGTNSDLSNTGTIVINGDLTSNDRIKNASTAATMNPAIEVNGFWDIAYEAGAIDNKGGSVTGSGHVNFLGSTAITIDNTAGTNGKTGTWQIDGTSTAITNTAGVTFDGGTLGGHITVATGSSLTINGATLGGRVDVTGTLNLGQTGAVTLDKGLIIDASNATSVSTNIKSIIGADANVTLLTSDGSTKTITNKSGAPASDVNITATNVTSAVAEVKSEARTMAAINTVPTKTSVGSTQIDLEKAAVYSDLSIGSPTITTSEDGKVTYYDYEVTGTLNYIADASGNLNSSNWNALGFPTERHWFFAVDFKGTTSTGATAIYLTKGGVGYTSRAALLADSDTNRQTGSYTSDDQWVKGFTSNTFKYAGIRYDFADGTSVWHIYNLSGCEYGSASAKG